MTTKINYAKAWEWSGYSLEQRPDGLWRHEQWSRVAGCRSGRVAVIEAPAGLDLEDEADLDTMYTGWVSKADYLKMFGHEVRCLRRGHIVQ